MTNHKRILKVALPLIVSTFAAAGTLTQASAQVALPTAPAADKAGNGGYTAARASLPGDNGSPLEPYLYLCILAGGGIIAGVGAVITDRRVRAAR